MRMHLALPYTSASLELTRRTVVSPLPLPQVYEGKSVCKHAFASLQTIDRSGVVQFQVRGRAPQILSSSATSGMCVHLRSNR